MRSPCGSGRSSFEATRHRPVTRWPGGSVAGCSERAWAGAQGGRNSYRCGERRRGSFVRSMRWPVHTTASTQSDLGMTAETACSSTTGRASGAGPGWTSSVATRTGRTSTRAAASGSLQLRIAELTAAVWTRRPRLDFRAAPPFAGAVSFRARARGRARSASEHLRPSRGFPVRCRQPASTRALSGSPSDGLLSEDRTARPPRGVHRGEAAAALPFGPAWPASLSRPSALPLRARASTFRLPTLSLLRQAKCIVFRRN